MTTVVSMASSPCSQPYSRPHSEVFAYEKVLVVLDGSRQITKYALEWALSNVLVRPGESITLLALHAPGSYGTRSTFLEMSSSTAIRSHGEVFLGAGVSAARVWRFGCR